MGGVGADDLGRARGAPQTLGRRLANGRQYSYGMFRRDRVVGGAGLMRRIAANGLEIGYWVHPAFTGEGLRLVRRER